MHTCAVFIPFGQLHERKIDMHIINWIALEHRQYCHELYNTTIKLSCWLVFVLLCKRLSFFLLPSNDSSNKWWIAWNCTKTRVTLLKYSAQKSKTQKTNAQSNYNVQSVESFLWVILACNRFPSHRNKTNYQLWWCVLISDVAISFSI